MTLAALALLGGAVGFAVARKSDRKRVARRLLRGESLGDLTELAAQAVTLRG